jgi:hypothetical protein
MFYKAETFLDIYSGRIETLKKKRIELLRPGFVEGIKHLDILDSELAISAVEIVGSFLHTCAGSK